MNTAEHGRLQENRENKTNWKFWGPYLSERQWGTVREDYSNDGKGALELNWSFPITRTLKGYFQYFNGYGECLLDYNHHNNRFSIGFALSDWL